jgi:hypothetical protein
LPVQVVTSRVVLSFIELVKGRGVDPSHVNSLSQLSNETPNKIVAITLRTKFTIGFVSIGLRTVGTISHSTTSLRLFSA